MAQVRVRLNPPMPIPATEQKILFLTSGGICAFPDCHERLVDASTAGSNVVIGEIAHIVADSRQGPRGRSDLSEEDRNKADNLVLLCPKHHKIIDSTPLTFSVEVLRALKQNHQQEIAQAGPHPAPASHAKKARETVHSTLLEITQLPSKIYAGPCDFDDRQEAEVRKLLNYPKGKPDELVPFLLRGHRLYAFHDLSNFKNPFVKAVNPTDVQTIQTSDFWEEPEGERRLVTLLNKSMYKYCARIGIRYDPAHYRFYFEPTNVGDVREESYRTLTGRRQSRKVVWQPKKKSTGELRNYWLHLAASLSFLQMAPKQWCLSIRLERHMTTDGLTPYEAKKLGRTVTRLKARMYNEIYLGETHFWRSILSGGQPRLVLDFGQQAAVVDTRLISLTTEWAGIPEDSRPFTNRSFEDDLFTFAELAKEDKWDEDNLEANEGEEE